MWCVNMQSSHFANSFPRSIAQSTLPDTHILIFFTFPHRSSTTNITRKNVPRSTLHDSVVTTTEDIKSVCLSTAQRESLALTAKARCEQRCGVKPERLFPQLTYHFEDIVETPHPSWNRRPGHGARFWTRGPLFSRSMCPSGLRS